MLPLPPPSPTGMGFMMPMFKEWVPKKIQPWIYIVAVFCFQFSSGIYLGALDDIRGTTDFMLEDLLMLLYAGLAGMAVYFPMLFRMKFHFTNQQLLCGAAVIIGVCNFITMYSTSMPVLLVVCFIAGMAKLQGTFECMSNIQLWITPRRDFGVFFPVLHIVLLTAIEGNAWLAAWFGYHFTWEMMHVFTIGTMCFVLVTQLTLCRPFCPMPQRLPLKGIDFLGGLLISILMLIISYVCVYGEYLMWTDNQNICILIGIGFMLFAFVLYHLSHVENPYISLRIFTFRNVVPILFVTIIAEILLGCEHTLEEIMYAEVYKLEEHTKENVFVWSLLGVYIGVAIDLFWLRVKRWKVWKLFAIGFACIFVYAILMYFTIDVNVNVEQFRLPTVIRGCAYAILAATLMWSLDESLHDLEHFFMGLFIFNIFHMYLAGAFGYAFYTKLFMHFFNDDMVRYGSQLTLTHLDLGHFDFGGFMENYYLRSMMTVSIKQVYGIVIWIAGFTMLAFFLLDIPRIRTNARRVPLWPVYGIEYFRKKMHKS